MNKAIAELIEAFDAQDYVLGEELATAIFLMQNLEKPLLLEGQPGVGKTMVASTLAACLKTPLIRLQCYEGLDVNTTIYEWNYQKQLLHIKLFEKEADKKELSDKIFGMDYILERPLLKSITAEKPVVLLIDEIDRADEEFEAYLLELLSDFQISIPELGTVKAKSKPMVILTSNRTRELGDALKRRCLYQWINFPSREKEVAIIRKKLPELQEELAVQIVRFISNLRAANLQKTPGIAETLDWAKTLLLLNYGHLSEEAVQNTIGSILKSQDDIDFVKSRPLEEFLLPAK